MSPPWFHPDSHARRRPFLLARARAAAAIRAFLGESGCIEVDTPALQISPGLEPHLRAFATTLEKPFDQGRATLRLHTSPEFAMKKILAAGETAIFQLAHVFRNGERGPTHHPEFTMLEWYRSAMSYEALMAETEDLVRAVARATGAERLVWGDAAADPFGPWERLSVAQALERYAGIDLLGALDAGVAISGNALEPDAGALAEAARAIGIACSPNDRFEDVFFRIVLDRVEHRLGHERPCILYDYPACMAALSRRKDDDPRLAERFEVYVGGLELANAFGELTDAAEQRARFTHDMDVKEALYGERYPIDGDFLEALDQGLAPCSGIALGFDRLVMLCTGADAIDDVLWAPVADP
ncbi:EF-P lysine aminoacylase EpmA [Rhodospirillum rubrum]|uniref:EF-P lysine aminoacylase EpmA n=1 Tax=Rhodospirillum rubrum TaxID=1085 RepID=UPI001915302B|nr:EF-P lysine aminoacylase EpmA [Rhodospirillum rubrum]MBK5953442.1 EF-P lysine aminoacylase GenX [Rhodospirillum rubrum]